MAARLNKWLNVNGRGTAFGINLFQTYFIAIKEFKLMLKIILVMVIKKPQEISIHWVFVQEKIRYPKQEPISTLRKGIQESVFSCTWIKAKDCLACPKNKLCFTNNYPLFSLGAPSTSHNLFLLVYHLAAPHLLSTLLIFGKYWNKIVFSHVIKATPKCFDHFQSRFT